MTKEEQMREMRHEAWKACARENNCCEKDCAHCIANKLYNAGYRKADEVRRETAQRIINLVHEIGGCDATDDWSKGYDAAIDTVYNMIAKEYGVEVE